MTQVRLTAVDEYLASLLIPPDPALEEGLRASAEAELPWCSRSTLSLHAGETRV